MTKPKRLRLPPDERRRQLLRAARIILMARGVSSLTMEAVAKEAGASNPLIYKYFETRLGLLQELFQRELVRYYSDIKLKLEKAEAIEDVIRIAVTANFDEWANGSSLEMLRSQPDIEAGLDKKELTDTLGVGELLIDRLMDAHAVSRSQATKMTVFGSGASQAAALQWRLYGGNRERLIEDVLQFIHAGMESFIPANQQRGT